MGEMQFSILNSHYQQHKWAGPIYNSYHSPSRASHPSYLPWEPYHVNPESHSSLTEKRYNTLESVLLGEIPASYSHLTTTSSHLSSSPSATSSCSSSSSSPCASSDGSYSASPHPSSSHSPTPLVLQNESIQPAATDLSDYQSEPMDLSCKTPISGNGDTICYAADRSFLNSAASYSYSPHHDNSVTDGSLISSSAGGQTFLSSENFERTQQCRSPIQHQVIRVHSPEQHQQHPHLHCQQPLLSNRHSPVQRVQCESPMQQIPHQPHQESPLHYQVSSESALHQTFSSVTSQEIQIQRRESNSSCRSPMPFSTQSSQNFSGNSRHSASPSSSAIHLHHTSASTSLESSQSLYDGQSVQSKPQSIHQSDGNSSSVDSHESNRPVQTNHSVSSQISKTAGHSLLRDLLSCGRNNKSQENQGASSLPSDNCYSITASHSSSSSSSISSSLRKDDNLSSQAKAKEEYVGSKDYSLCSTTRVTLAKKNLLPISARVTEWLYKMVKFAKEIPQFVKLPNNDRLTLILNSWTRLLLMHMAENNFQFAVTPLPFSPDHKTDEAPASNEPTMKSVESVQSFIRKCQSMNLDTSEFEYLRMLVLFNAGYVGLEKSSAVDSMNSHIQQHLQQHIHAKHPSEQIRFSRVLMCLPSLYGINCKMIDNLFCGFIHGKTDIEVLLKDMLQDL